MTFQARSRLLVLRNFQRWFLTTFVIYVGTFLAVFALGLYLWFRIVVREMMNFAGVVSPTFRLSLEKHLHFGLYVTATFLIGLLVVAGLQALLFGKKIAGPIFALTRHFDKCQETGQLEHLRLRKDDLFGEVATQFNAMIDRVEIRKNTDSPSKPETKNELKKIEMP